MKIMLDYNWGGIVIYSINRRTQKIASSAFIKIGRKNYMGGSNVAAFSSADKKLLEDINAFSCSISKGASQRTYTRFPRKMKKAIRNLQEYRWGRLTKRMNIILNLQME